MVKVVPMSESLNPVNRVWHPKVVAGVPAAQAKFDIYGNDLPEPDVREKNTDSIWDTFDALQAAETARLAKLNCE
jgi:hypothetical protein